MASAAVTLKELRKQARPALTVRAMADKLGMPLSSYSRYETAAKFKRRYLPMAMARQIAAVLADHGIEPAEVMALAGIEEEPSGIGLSAGEEQLLDRFRQLEPDQRSLLLQLADAMQGASTAPAQTSPSLHGPRQHYAGEERRA